MRIFFIFNLHAGKGRVKMNLPAMINIISAEGHDLSVYSTQYAGEARDKIANLPDGKYDRVLCAGGDGTLDEVVAGMNMRAEKLPIGYIPAGSTNDFAVSLGLPKRMREATRVAIGDHVINCDVGAFNDKSFVYIAAFGMFTEVSYETPQEIKNVIGHSAYILEGIKRLQDVNSYSIKIEADGEIIEKEFIFGMVTNSQSVGGFKHITGKDVDLNDGLFEVTLVERPSNPLLITETMNALINRDFKTPGLITFKTSKVTFTSEEEIPWTLDGEFGGAERSVVIENLHNNMQIATT